MPTTKPNPNFFAGSPLNRLSWLRPSHPFLNALVLFPATRWIIFNGGQPLVVMTSGSTSARTESATNNVKHQLAHVSTDDVLPLLGPQPFFGQAEEEGQLVPNTVRTLGSIRHRGPRIVFLGLHQTSEAGGEPNGDGGTLTLILSPDVREDALEQAVAGLNGTPFFCVDVADVEQSVVDVMLKQAVERWSWMDARAVMACLDASAAGMYAQARSMADWNQRNKVSAFGLARCLGVS
jgi:NAD+ diphosphatase